jgi:hypothetical protein
LWPEHSIYLNRISLSIVSNFTHSDCANSGTKTKIRFDASCFQRKSQHQYSYSQSHKPKRHRKSIIPSYWEIFWIFSSPNKINKERKEKKQKQIFLHYGWDRRGKKDKKRPMSSFSIHMVFTLSTTILCSHITTVLLGFIISRFGSNWNK